MRLKRRVRAATDSTVLYTPWERLARQIALSARVIEGRLDTISELLQHHLTVSQALNLTKIIQDPMSSQHDRTLFYDPIWSIVNSALIAGYADGNAARGRIAPAGYVATANKIADARASEVDKLMRATTRSGLRTNALNSYLLSSARAERAVRYEAATHYNQGLLSGAAGSNMMKGWVTTGDDPCPICIENEDADWMDLFDRFPSGDMAPLAHLNCFAGTTTLLASGLSRMYRRRYQGKMIRLRVGNDGEVFVTPNHPILTRRGWIAAAELLQSDDLLTCIDDAVFQRIAAAVNPNDKQIKFAFEDGFRSTLMSRSVRARRMPSSAKYFHGDGVLNDEVDVVDVECGLLSESPAFLLERLCEYFFNLRDAVGMYSRRMCSGLLLKCGMSTMRTTNSGVSIFDLPFTFQLGHALPANFQRIAHATSGQSKSLEAVLQRPTTDMEPLSKVLDRFSACMRFVKLSELCVCEEWRGHVFNAETSSHWYAADGIVAHNCQCVLTFW